MSTFVLGTWNVWWLDTLGFQPPLKHWVFSHNHHCLPKWFNHRNWVNHYFNGGGSPGYSFGDWIVFSSSNSWSLSAIVLQAAAGSRHCGWLSRPRCLTRLDLGTTFDKWTGQNQPILSQDATLFFRFHVPIGSMGLVYYPTFTIKINHRCRRKYSSPMDVMGVRFRGGVHQVHDLLS